MAMKETFNREDADLLKAELTENMADMIKKFEEMIAGKLTYTGKKPAVHMRRHTNTRALVFSPPKPAVSGPNIIDLAANVNTNLEVTLLEVEVDQPAPSKRLMTEPAVPVRASNKGKEIAPPVEVLVPQSTAEDSEDNESEISILARQVALKPPTRGPILPPRAIRPI
jgi:hypothetical protein